MYRRVPNASNSDQFFGIESLILAIGKIPRSEQARRGHRMAESANEELTKAEQKIKDEELTPAELKTFGILPPESDKTELVRSHESARQS
jgi:hypothetical protein